MNHTLPVIDIENIYSDNDFQLDALAREFLTIYSTYGFGYIVNHGIESSLLKNLFDQSAKFHALPSKQKMEIVLNSLHRGFIPINTSTDRNTPLAKIDKPNQSESFIIMREDSKDDTEFRNGSYLAGPNQWPSNLPGFRKIVIEYNNAIRRLAERLMNIFARAMDTEYESLKISQFSPATTWLRLLRYPTTPAQRADDLFGSAPHCDFGCITLLAQDENSGLQVCAPDGQWIDAPPLPNTLVLNVGNMLHRLSNGKLLSTPHRVINLSGKQRFSCAFFYDPNVKAIIKPLSSCVDNDNPRQFPDDLVFADYLRQELSSSYDTHFTKP